MARELVDVELLHKGDVIKATTSSADPSNPNDMTGLVQDMTQGLAYLMTQPTSEYTIRISKGGKVIGTYTPASQ